MGNMCSSDNDYIFRKDSYNVTQLRKAIKLSKNAAFLSNFRKFSKIFTEQRMKKISDKTKDSFFTDREKLMGLSLYKKCPKVYRWLSKIFVLPPIKELYKLSSNFNTEQGIKERMCGRLRSCLQKMQRARTCLLLFDEVAIGLCNSKGRKGNGARIADHALIFMIRFILSRKNQPIAYKFTHGRLNKEELSALIEKIITDLQRCGFKVVATLCDQNSRNVGTINKLIEKTRNKSSEQNSIELNINAKVCIHKSETFKVNCDEVVPLYDPLHLVKGMRNDLITKNLKCNLDGTVRIAKWQHIVQFERFASKYTVTQRHVNLRVLDKTDSTIAAQTLGDKNGRYIAFTAQVTSRRSDPPKSLPEEAVDTGHMLIFLDKILTSMSGYPPPEYEKHDDPLLRQVTTRSTHHKAWKEFLTVLNTMKFVTKEGTEVRTRSIDCWIHTLKNAEYLSRKLFSRHNVTKFWMSHIDMKPLADLIKRFRRHGCDNVTTYDIK